MRALATLLLGAVSMACGATSVAPEPTQRVALAAPRPPAWADCADHFIPICYLSQPTTRTVVLTPMACDAKTIRRQLDATVHQFGGRMLMVDLFDRPEDALEFYFVWRATRPCSHRATSNSGASICSKRRDRVGKADSSV